MAQSGSRSCTTTHPGFLCRRSSALASSQVRPVASVMSTWLVMYPGRSRARSTRYTSPRWIGLRTRRHGSGLYGRKTSAEVPQVEHEPFGYGWKPILYCHMFGGININPSCNSGSHLCAIWFWLSLRFIPVSQQCFPGTICRNHDLCSVNTNDSWDWWMCVTPSLRVSKLLTHPKMDKTTILIYIYPIYSIYPIYPNICLYVYIYIHRHIYICLQYTHTYMYTVYLYVIPSGNFLKTVEKRYGKWVRWFTNYLHMVFFPWQCELAKGYGIKFVLFFNVGYLV